MSASSGAFGKGTKPGAAPEPEAGGGDSDEMATATGSKKTKSTKKSKTTSKKSKTASKAKAPVKRGKSKFTLEGSPVGNDSRFEWALIAFLLVAILLVL